MMKEVNDGCDGVFELDKFVLFLKNQGLTPKTCIDVGACYGTPEIFRNLPEAYHIYFEPNPDMEERLSFLCEKFLGEYHIMALSDSVGEQSFSFVQGQPESGTLALSGSEEHSGVQSQVVKVDTLDRVLGGRRFEGPILLKTDCQGFDLEVLRGGVELLKTIDVVVSEVNCYHAAGDKERSVFSDYVRFFDEQGFELLDVVSYNSRPLDSALGYVDLAFVRRGGARIG